MKMFARAFVFAFAALTVAATAAQAQRGPGGHGGGGFGGGDHGGGFGGDHGGGRGPGGGGWGGDHGGGRGPGGGGWGGDHGGGGWHRGGGWDGGGTVYVPGCSYNCDGGYVGGTVACAPETFEGNVASTDRVLKTLIATKDFASATQFKAQVSKISAMSDAGAKATAYLKIAGIDSNDSKAVVAFIGARDAQGAWITDLQRNADLTSAQAEAVATKLQVALRGNLQ